MPSCSLLDRAYTRPWHWTGRVARRIEQDIMSGRVEAPGQPIDRLDASVRRRRHRQPRRCYQSDAHDLIFPLPARACCLTMAYKAESVQRPPFLTCLVELVEVRSAVTTSVVMRA